MKRTFTATAIVLAMVIMVFGASAHADIVFSGASAATGSAPNSSNWVWNTTGGGVYPFLPAGNGAWGIPGLGLGTSGWTSPLIVDDFAIVFDTTFAAGMPTISTAPAVTGGGYDETTRFSVNGVLWNTVFVTPTEVEFFAPNGAADLVAGDQYFVNVVFNGPVNPAEVSFAAAFSTVPVPPSLLLLAPGLLGLVGLRKKIVR